MPESAKKSFVILVYIVLTLSTIAVFWQVCNYDFTNYDDNYCVSENRYVSGGLTLGNVVWAFTTGLTANWHPLTWLSLMLDCQLFGPNPGWIHLINVFLHLANSLLLFAVFKKMTGSLWQSAFVAAAFAIHPMHVESVAWIAERKDVLSVLFWMLTLVAYVAYVKKQNIIRYLMSIVLFTLGLMAKPMLVTMPFVLLLLDYWPLDRFEPQTVKTSGRQSRKSAPIPDNRRILYRIIVEKIPFFALSAVSSMITFFVQRSGGAVIDINSLPLKSRVANVFVSYAAYIGKMFWPQGLAIFYPFNIGGFPVWQVALCICLLFVISVFVIYFGRKRRYLLVGWLWFVVTLIPVIGLVQIGSQSLADRYTYIPYIGLFIMIAWGLPGVFFKWPHRKIILGVSILIVLTALGICAHRQVGYWKDTSTVFLHALDVTKNNYLAHSCLGKDLLRQGDYASATEHYTEALRINPLSANAHNNLGIALAKQGNFVEAVVHFNEAVSLMPDFAGAHDNLANALIVQGKLDDAVVHFKEAVRLKPDKPEPMSNLAMLIAVHPEIKNRDVNEAIRLATYACELTKYRNPVMMGTLAAAYASAEKFSEAIDTINKAINLAEAADKPQLKYIFQSHRSLYIQSKPYIEHPPRRLPTDNP
jgi:Flp pilus assembly protein TadD